MFKRRGDARSLVCSVVVVVSSDNRNNSCIKNDVALIPQEIRE